MRPELRSCRQSTSKRSQPLRRETLLIVTDRLLRGSARHSGRLHWTGERDGLPQCSRGKRAAKEPPAPVVQAMASADVVVASHECLFSRTPRRGGSVQGWRQVATLPGITEGYHGAVPRRQISRRSQRGRSRDERARGKGTASGSPPPRGTDITFFHKRRETDREHGSHPQTGEFGIFPRGKVHDAGRVAQRKELSLWTARWQASGASSGKSPS